MQKKSFSDAYRRSTSKLTIALGKNIHGEPVTADLATMPANLRLIGESAAGRPFDGTLKPGETVRIFTGSVLPQGAEQVVPQENVVRAGDQITINAPPKSKFVRRQGLDFKAGQVMLESGRRLNARDGAVQAGAVPSLFGVRIIEHLQEQPNFGRYALGILRWCYHDPLL